MKKLLIAVIALFAFSSCKKSGVILTEKIPELKGEWVWTHTCVGGVVGVVYPEPEKSLVIDFKDNNTISIKYDGETIVNPRYQAKLDSNKAYVNKQITGCLAKDD